MTFGHAVRLVMGFYICGMSVWAPPVMLAQDGLLLTDEATGIRMFVFAGFNCLVAAVSVAYCIEPGIPEDTRDLWPWLHMQAAILGGIYTTAMASWTVWANGHTTWTIINLVMGIVVVAYGTVPQQQGGRHDPA